MKDNALTTCPKCSEDKLVRLISGGIAGFVNSPRTVGALADRNAARMSKEQKGRAAEEQRTQKDQVLYEQLPAGMSRMEKPKQIKQPWYKKGQIVSTKKITKMTEQQKKKYIKTGQS